MVLDPKSDGREFEATEWPFDRLTHANGVYLSRLEARLKKVGLDVPRWRVLMCIKPGDASSVSEIAESAIVKLPTMMKLIQRMVADDLVRCQTRESDGRVTDVSLTPAGEEARKRAWQTASRIFTKAFSSSAKRDLQKLNSLLQQMIERLKDDD